MNADSGHLAYCTEHPNDRVAWLALIDRTLEAGWKDERNAVRSVLRYRRAARHWAARRIVQDGMRNHSGFYSYLLLAAFRQIMPDSTNPFALEFVSRAVGPRITTTDIRALMTPSHLLTVQVGYRWAARMLGEYEKLEGFLLDEKPGKSM